MGVREGECTSLSDKHTCLRRLHSVPDGQLSKCSCTCTWAAHCGVAPTLGHALRSSLIHVLPLPQ